MDIKKVTVIKPHWCRKMRQLDGRTQHSRHKQRYLKKIKDEKPFYFERENDGLCYYCGDIAIWYIVKPFHSTSTNVCETCLKSNYERCKSHQIIEKKYPDGHIEIVNKYCTIVYPNDSNIRKDYHNE